MTSSDLAIAALAAPLHAVTDKPWAPGGDTHNFYAIGRYCWPNPDSADGLPYSRIDCEVNEESAGPRYDLQRYQEFIDTVTVLTAQYAASGDETFAIDAVRRLHTWFIDPETAMHPNLNHAAALPGVYDGVWFGIIQGAPLLRVIAATRVLRRSAALSDLTLDGLREWFGAYTRWLHESPFGVEHSRSTKCNNTWTWFYAQRAISAEFAGVSALVDPAVTSIVAGFDRQVRPDGSLPEELRRPTGLVYSLFAMSGFVTAAPTAGRAGIDLWHHSTPDGASLRTCFDYLSPHLLAAVDDARSGALDHAVWLYRAAARAYDEAAFLTVSDLIARRSHSTRAALFGPAYDPLVDTA